MKKLSLYFSNSEHPELHRFEVEHPVCGTKRISIRGKDIGAYSNVYTFQWTQAVKALTVLFLKGAQDLNYVLEGTNGSLASSLDYSIAKSTKWLEDLFGVDTVGRLNAKRLFKRTNSDRNYAGPVAVSLNFSQWHDVQIAVYLDQVALEKRDYSILASKIETGLYVEAIVPDKKNTVIPDLNSYLVKIYENEFNESIYRTDIFTAQSIKSSLHAIRQAGFYRKIAGKEFELNDSKLNTQKRLGLGLNYNQAKLLFKNTSVIGSGTLIGPILIFHHLLKAHNIKFDLNFNFPHAVGAVRMMIDGELDALPDIFCCGLAPAATLTASKLGKDYIPIMLLPDSSQKIVAHKNALKNKPSFNNARYSLLKEEPSIPAFMLEELMKMGQFSKNKVKLEHNEPDESFMLMQQGDPDLRTAVFFPHYNFNCDFNNCVTLPDPRRKANSQEVIMFVHKRKAINPRFIQTLECLIRDAWLDLKIQPGLVGKTVESLLNPDDAYFKSVVRFGGLHNLKLD